mmetsp:Transcript_24911/g.44368  ORF Transcript_24911/g.44368 Transcript_24911/m.44368 type:complete len:226 (+) Transcript_24911:176-853(+)
MGVVQRQSNCPRHRYCPRGVVSVVAVIMVELKAWQTRGVEGKASNLAHCVNAAKGVLVHFHLELRLGPCRAAQDGVVLPDTVLRLHAHALIKRPQPHQPSLRPRERDVHELMQIFGRTRDVPHAHLVDDTIEKLERVAVLLHCPNQHRCLGVVVLRPLLLLVAQRAVDKNTTHLAVVDCGNVGKVAHGQLHLAPLPPRRHLAVEKHVTERVNLSHATEMDMETKR